MGKLWTSSSSRGWTGAGGGGTTHAVSDAGVWPPSLALTEVTTTSTAWPDHHTPVARRSRAWRDPPATARFVRPFFGRLFGVVEENLISVDPVRCLMSFSPLPPGVMKHVRRQPNFSPPLDRFGGRKLGRVHVSGNPCDPHVQQSYGNRRRGLRLSSSSISSCKRLPSSFRGFG